MKIKKAEMSRNCNKNIMTHHLNVSVERFQLLDYWLYKG